MRLSYTLKPEVNVETLDNRCERSNANVSEIVPSASTTNGPSWNV